MGRGGRGRRDGEILPLPVSAAEVDATNVDAVTTEAEAADEAGEAKTKQ